jgi:hypothetical protein
MFWIAIGVAMAGLPDIDKPHRTSARAPGDAAVVIGIDDYLRIPNVPHASEDARAFADTLVYTIGIPQANVTRLENEGSREQIIAAVREAAGRVGRDGRLWVYFAGHGAADPSTGRRMLLGDDVRSDPESFVTRSVSMEELHGLGAGLPMTVVVDACYSGVGRTGDPLLGTRFAVPAYAQQADPNHIEWNAAGPDEVSNPLDIVKHGAFTYFAVGAMRGWADGELDGRQDGVVSGDEAQAFVTRGLREVGVRNQHPVLSASLPELSRGEEVAPADMGSAARATDGVATVERPTKRARRDGRNAGELVFRMQAGMGSSPRGMSEVTSELFDNDNSMFGTVRTYQTHRTSFGAGPGADLAYSITPAWELGARLWVPFVSRMTYDVNYSSADATSTLSSSGGDGNGADKATMELGLTTRIFPTPRSFTRPFLTGGFSVWQGQKWKESDSDETDVDGRVWLLFTSLGAGLETSVARKFDLFVVPQLDIATVGKSRYVDTVGDGAPIPAEAEESAGLLGFTVMFGFQARSVLR